MNKSMILLALTPFLLSGCDNQKVADEKLSRGCEAAVRVILNKDMYDRKLDKVTSSTFGKSDGYRLVTLSVVTLAKEYNDAKDETFDCKFEVSSGPFGMGWSASLSQLKVGDTIYGRDGGEISGSIEDQISLTEAVEDAMK